MADGSSVHCELKWLIGLWLSITPTLIYRQSQRERSQRTLTLRKELIWKKGAESSLCVKRRFITKSNRVHLLCTNKGDEQILAVFKAVILSFVSLKFIDYVIIIREPMNEWINSKRHKWAKRSRAPCGSMMSTGWGTCIHTSEKGLRVTEVHCEKRTSQ